MIKQTLIPLTIILVIAFGAFWFASPFTESSGGQAVAAETEEAPAKPAGTSKPDLWTVRCSETKDPETEKVSKHCEIVQRIVETETRKLFSEIAIGYPSDSDAARGVIILPLGTLLEPGVKMQIDSGQVYNFNFRYCVAAKIEGCVAVVKLPDSIITEMKKGKQAAISFINVRGQTVNLPITLTGFTKAITELNEG